MRAGRAGAPALRDRARALHTQPPPPPRRTLRHHVFACTQVESEAPEDPFPFKTLLAGNVMSLVGAAAAVAAVAAVAAASC
jgi:hypothetical protein